MLIYEKNNKLNINFDPSKSIEGTPDIQIGENEIKLGDAEITSENVLPTPTNEDVGKVPTVQEDGTYGLENIPSELPVATPEDEGKVVTVSQDGGYELTEASSPLPVPVLPEDIGKTIVVNEDGSYALAEAGGGATVLTLYAKDNDNYLYLDEACTQKFRTRQEAVEAIDNATKVIIKQNSENRIRFYYPASLYCAWFGNGSNYVYLLANSYTVANEGGTNPTFTPEVKTFILKYYWD